MARFGLSWLAKQAAARILRTNWTAQLLAEEFWTILTKLRDLEPESINVPTTDGVKNFQTIQLGDTDLVFTDNTEEQVVDPPNPTDPTYGSQHKVIWERTVLPCLVGSKGGTTQDKTIYNVTLYPYGDMVPLDAGDNPADASTYDELTDSGFTISTTARQLQLRDGEVIPEGSWTLAVYMQQFKITEETKNGAVISQDIIELQTGCYMQLPVWM